MGSLHSRARKEPGNLPTRSCTPTSPAIHARLHVTGSGAEMVGEAAWKGWNEIMQETEGPEKVPEFCRVLGSERVQALAINTYTLTLVGQTEGVPARRGCWNGYLMLQEGISLCRLRNQVC